MITVQVGTYSYLFIHLHCHTTAIHNYVQSLDNIWS